MPAVYAVAATAVVMVALILPTPPAQSATFQVTSLTARAYAISASVPSVPPLLTVPPAPVVTAPPCPTDSGDFQGTGAVASPLLLTGVLSARVDCPQLPASLPLLLPVAQADVANATFLAGTAGAVDALAVSGVHAECSITESGPVGDTTIATLRLLGNPIDVANVPANLELNIPAGTFTMLPAPAPPFPVPLPDIKVVLNEQKTTNGVLSVNAVHITTSADLLPPLFGPVDIVLAHAECSAVIGLIPTTTSSSTTSSSTSSTSSTSTSSTSTTRPPTTVAPTTVPGATTTLVGSAATTTTLIPALVPLTAPPRPPSLLARTGSSARTLVVFALAAAMIGAILRRAGHDRLPLPVGPAPSLMSEARRIARRLVESPRRRSWRQ